MTSWYIVKRGAEIIDKTFDTYEDAEMFAMGLAVITGNLWKTEKVFGWC